MKMCNMNTKTKVLKTKITSKMLILNMYGKKKKKYIYIYVWQLLKWLLRETYYLLEGELKSDRVKQLCSFLCH